MATSYILVILGGVLLTNNECNVIKKSSLFLTKKKHGELQQSLCIFQTFNQLFRKKLPVGAKKVNLVPIETKEHALSFSLCCTL
jgi:hypothetical protein